jgi:Tol biopolymer transport system component
LLPFDGSNEGRPVGPPGAACTEAAWSPDGQWMHLNSNAGGSFHIWRQRFPDGVPVQMTSGPTEEHGIAVAPDGRSIVTSVGITTSSLWIRDGRGLREVSTEGNASLPGSAASAAMPRGTYFSPDRQKLYYLTRRSRGAMLLDGELWEADLRSGRTQVILPGFTVGSFDVSADGTRIVFAAADPNGRPRLWHATLDGAARPRQISTKDDDHPLFGASGDILFRSSHDGANFLYRMNEDGTGRTRIAERPILAIQSVSPDKQWVVAYAAMTNAEVSVAANAFPTAGGAPKRVCNQCKISWSQSGSHLYMSVDWGGGRTYVIRVQPTRPFPRLPPQGIRSEADLVGLPVVRVIEGTEVAPVEDGSVYAFTRVGEQRNLYRVPVPR